MGGKFSSGAYPKGFDKTLLMNIDINWVKSKVNLFERIKRGRLSRYNDLFITQAEVQFLFHFSQRESHEFFGLMDHEQLRRIPIFDLWGALTLAANCSMNEKIEFLFEVLDFNKDGYATKLDIENMFVCATRGLARVKSISPPPQKALREVINKATKSKSTILNESGEICTLDLKVFMVSSDACRKYFSNLGTNIEVKDENKLLQQRTDMLIELMEIEQKILELEFSESIKSEDALVYAKERGGEEQLVRISDAQMARLGSHVDRTNEDFDEIRLALTAKKDLKAQAMEDQYQRRAHRSNEELVEEIRLKDAVAFSPSRNCKPSAPTDHVSNISDHAFEYRWSKLPQDADGFSKLDIDTIEDLFEASGILLTDSNAQNCLQAIPTNQLGRHNKEDVLAWHHDFVLWGSTKKPHFREVAEEFGSQRDYLMAGIHDVINILNIQKEYIEHNEEMQGKLKEIIEKQRQDLTQSRLQVNHLNDSGHSPNSNQIHDSLSPDSKSPRSPSSDLVAKKGFNLQLAKEQLVGSVRLAAWQRQQVLNPASKITIRSTFGLNRDAKGSNNILSNSKSTDTSPGKGKQKQKISPKKAIGVTVGKLQASESTKRIAVDKSKDEPVEYKMQFGMSFTVKPLMDSRVDSNAKFINKSTKEISNLYTFEASDLLNHFTYEFQGLLGPVSKQFGTVTWLAFTVCPHASDEEALIFHLACRSFFISVPWQERHTFYTEVRSELLTVAVDTQVKGKSAPNNESPIRTAVSTFSPAHKGTKTEGLQGLWRPAVDSSSNDDPSSTPQRVVLVALLHEDDEFRLMEDLLPAGVILSRAIREATLEMNIVQDLPELYKLNFPFEYFRDRLYGPQEDELGEDGMNPLRFAKMCRKRQVAAQQAIDQAPNMTFDELRGHCRTRGLDDTGNKQDLILRVQAAFKRQLDMIGFGELSAFGEDMCKTIFNRFKDRSVVDTDGLNLWELNEMLYSAGSDKVAYDMNEYKLLLKECEFRSDKQGRLHSDGLTSYFERFGRLGDAIHKLGIGSLDDQISGEIKLKVDFDNEGFASLLPLFSSNTVGERILKSVIRFFSCLENISSDAEYNNLSEVFQGFLSYFRSSKLMKTTPVESELENLFGDILSCVQCPGWLASKLHRLIEELANGETGIIRSMRVFLMTEFSSYANWEANFKDHIKSWAKLCATSAVSVDDAGVSDNVSVISMDNLDTNRSIHSDNQSMKSVNSKPSKSSLRTDMIGSPSVGAVSASSNDKSTKKAQPEFDELFSEPNTARTNDDKADDVDSDEMTIEAKIRKAQEAKAAEASLAAAEEEEEKRLVLLEQERIRKEQYFQSCLPELASTKHLTEERYHELTENSKRLRDLLLNDSIHLNRSEREELRFAKDKIDHDAVKLRLDLEDSKGMCAAHACAFYDAMRLYGSELVNAGWGTKEISIRGYSKGFRWASLLPKANGELSIPLQMREGKLRRAAQRKNAALAALEREQHRRKMDDAEKEKHAKENENKKDKRLEDEERLLFAEAFDMYCVAKEERQLTPTLEKMASLWEKLSVMKSLRYAKSLQAMICQNNLACICLLFFSKTHPRWSDAAGNLEACSNGLYAYLEDLTMKASENPGKLTIITPNTQDPNLPAGNIATSTTTTTTTTAMEVTEPTIPPDTPTSMQRSESMASLSSSTKQFSKAGSFDMPVVSLVGEKVFPRIVLGVPEAQISSIILILQNHVTYIRLLAITDSDGNTRFDELSFRQRRWIERNQSLILALMEKLPDNERERIYNGIAKSANHLPILFHGNITEELNKTTEELKLREQKELQRLEDLRRKQEEEEAAAEAERLRLEDARQAADDESFVKETDLRSLLSNSVGDDSIMSLELAMQRDDKAKKYQKQRELDKITRDRVSKHRTKLYAMIRSDEISKVFKAHAKSVDLDADEVIHWGKSQEELMQTEAFDRP